MTDTSTPSALILGVPGFTYADLYRPERLRDLHDVFLQEVGDADPDLRQKWDTYRADPEALRPAPEVSLLYVRMAPHLSRFLARMFGIEADVRAVAAATAEQDVLFRFKADFVRRRVLPLVKGGQPVAVTDEDRAQVDSLVRGQHPSDGEMALARAGCLLLDREIAAGKAGDDAEKAAVSSAIDALRRWCAAHMHDEEYRSWVVFQVAGSVDYFNLVEVERPDAGLPTSMVGPDAHLRRRDGFKLTDPRMTAREVLSEINYCVLCHEREKDSCSRGLLTKEGKPQANPLGIPLEGCPLDERISEMHMVRKRGDAVGALALVTVDNPMCAGTGHRICNDCMKACIFQKQDPVDIPQIETGILTDVLRLPWGVEIYGLLTRWNPLNVRRPYALPYNGRKVLVVGMGPAGYTLAHYLV
ncbi:MAG: pyridine nucleotide-disulfide oxidoreductase, partial [Rhodospirillaceae bacterium]